MTYPFKPRGSAYSAVMIELWGRESPEEIGAKLGYSSENIKQKASRMGLKPWNPSEAMREKYRAAQKKHQAHVPDKPKGLHENAASIAGEQGATLAEVWLLVGMVREGVLMAHMGRG